ncbi:hypothetical protein [Dyadobacter sp. CY347]|uniref:hypothetical protein n=1 Tax=Dyadobacter sp. CY347 TaxID=2909336 RepID=UPI001F474A76|nr:hypothetical protein [Dyadobacter sp. CY347]MCF2489850.1 hypothetical protein [Dyadobacter sp. CY347]
MNLVKQLPIGLGLACLMMMSSCSKEDVQTLEPLKSERTDASMRDDGGYIKILPIFHATFGPLGSNVYPNGWQRGSSTSSNLIGYPTGSSNFTHLFGNPAWPWVNPISPIQDVPNASSFLTISTKAKKTWTEDGASTGKRSSVETIVKNLTPGKMYELTYYTTSSVCAVKQNNLTPAYASAVVVDWIYSNGTKKSALTMSLKNWEGTWNKQTITFEANEKDQVLNFTAFTESESTFGYAHIFVDHKSIKEVEPLDSPF